MSVNIASPGNTVIEVKTVENDWAACQFIKHLSTDEQWVILDTHLVRTSELDDVGPVYSTFYVFGRTR